jgi:hypothetical protein
MLAACSRGRDGHLPLSSSTCMLTRLERLQRLVQTVSPELQAQRLIAHYNFRRQRQAPLAAPTGAVTPSAPSAPSAPTPLSIHHPLAPDSANRSHRQRDMPPTIARDLAFRVFQLIKLPRCPVTHCSTAVETGRCPALGRFVAVEVSAPKRQDYALDNMTEQEWSETVCTIAAGFNAMHGMTLCCHASFGERYAEGSIFNDKFMRVELFMHPPKAPNDSE